MYVALLDAHERKIDDAIFFILVFMALMAIPYWLLTLQIKPASIPVILLIVLIAIGAKLLGNTPYYRLSKYIYVAAYVLIALTTALIFKKPIPGLEYLYFVGIVLAAMYCRSSLIVFYALMSVFSHLVIISLLPDLILLESFGQDMSAVGICFLCCTLAAILLVKLINKTIAETEPPEKADNQSQTRHYSQQAFSYRSPKIYNLVRKTSFHRSAALARLLKKYRVGLSLEDRVKLLEDFYHIHRHNRSFKPHSHWSDLVADQTEQVNYRRPSIDPLLLEELSACRWIKSHSNVVITGPAGTGKTYLAHTLANTALRQDFKVQYFSVPQLIANLASARIDGTYDEYLRKAIDNQLLVLDDWLLSPLSADQANVLLAFIKAGSQTSSMIIASTPPLTAWGLYILDPLASQFILDLVSFNSYHIELKNISAPQPVPDHNIVYGAAEDGQTAMVL